MAKNTPPDQVELLLLLQQMNEKISSARVLNGGFDRLEKQVGEIRDLQAKFNADFQNHVVNDARIEEKIDRLYDPEEGIYSKVAKTEAMLTTLTDNVQRLSDADATFSDKLNKIEKTSSETSQKVEAIQKIAGEDNKDLVKAVKTSKGFWKFAIWAGTGLLAAIGKVIWDLFVV